MLPPGTLIAERYEIAEHMSGGGMGAVYRAVDRRLGREVALKLLHPWTVGDDGSAARFEREARSAAAISHPNVVAVYDFGRSEQDAYLVMELLGEGTLRDVLSERGPLSPEDAVDLARQIAEGVAEAHRHGLTHRDLKPSNVLLAADGRPKVADFGLARSEGAEAITDAGQAVGSVHYLSPEQARGERAGPPSDVYSLGIILYELLTGQVPFDAPTAVAVAYKHVNEEPPPPSTLRPDVPDWLDLLVLRCLAKHPAERPSDAGALAVELGGDGPTGEQQEEHTAPLPALSQTGPTAVSPAVVPTATMEPLATSEHEPGPPRGRLARRALVIAAVGGILVGGALLARAVLWPGSDATAGPDTESPLPRPTTSLTTSPPAELQEEESPEATPTPTPSETSATPSEEPEETRTPSPTESGSESPTAGPSGTSTPTAAPTTSSAPTDAPDGG